MGGSSSKAKTKQTITNNTVNQNFMDTVNKNIMNSSVETLVNSASSCSSSVDQTNQCSFKDSTVAGDFNLNATQTNVAKVNFSCVQAAQASADMASTMAQSMISQMKSLNGTDAAANLNAAASGSNQTGALTTGGGSTSTQSNANVTNNVTNETITRVENLFESNLSNNFTSNTVNECIGKTSQSNVVDVEGVTVGGNANVGCTQTNSIEVVQECKQLSEAINKTTQEVFNELGLTIASESDTSTATESTVSAKSENVSTGLVQDLGSAVSGILDSFGGILGAFGLAALAPYIGSFCMICCCVLSVVLIFTAMGMSGSGGGSSSSSMGSMDSLGASSAGLGSLAGMGSMGSSMGSMGSSMGSMASLAKLFGGGTGIESFNSPIVLSETDLSGTFRVDYKFS